MVRYKKVAKEEYEALALKLKQQYDTEAWYIGCKPAFDDGGKMVDLIVDRLLYKGDSSIMRSYDGLAVCVVTKYRPGTTDIGLKLLAAVASV